MPTSYTGQIFTLPTLRKREWALVIAMIPVVIVVELGSIVVSAIRGR